MPNQKLKLTKRPLIAPKQQQVVEYNGNTKYDWPAIKAEYIGGYEKEPGVIYFPNTKELAERYPDVPYGQIRNRCSKEKWEEYKQKAMRAAAVARHKEQLKRMNNAAILFDQNVADDAAFAINLLKKQMIQFGKIMDHDEARLVDIFERIDAGEDVSFNEFKPLVSPSAWESMGKAYALFVEVGRKALGIKDDEPAIHQQVNIEVTHNTTVTQELQKNDPARLAALQRIFQNQNLILPAGDTVDAEIVEPKEITDGTDEELDDED